MTEPQDPQNSSTNPPASQAGEDPIAAIATPLGEGALSLLRLTGHGVPRIAEKIFRPRGSRPLLEGRPGSQRFGKLIDPKTGDAVDEAVLTFHRAPRSFTGEDLVEITCHGGIVVTRRVLDLCLNHGARMAEPGEFSRRAFANGKLDLTQAEAIMDLITARTELAAKAAAEQLEGSLGREINALRDDLLALLAHVEAYIDFPEEDIDPETGQTLREHLLRILTGIEKLLSTADQGRILREGVRTVIVGEPNAGKSSLLNRLLGFERAIVSQTAGTTRDSIEEAINLRGIPLLLTDTAGLREVTDDVERQGIERTLKILDRADLVLLVADASQPRGEWFRKIQERGGQNILPVLNKADLPTHPDWQDDANTAQPRVSAISGQGMEDLSDAIWNRVTSGHINFHESSVTINERHRHCLQNARDSLTQARQAHENATPPEFLAQDLHEALHHLGNIIGHTDTEQLLGEIFSRFCIGK